MPNAYRGREGIVTELCGRRKRIVPNGLENNPIHI